MIFTVKPDSRITNFSCINGYNTILGVNDEVLKLIRTVTIESFSFFYSQIFYTAGRTHEL